MTAARLLRVGLGAAMDACSRQPAGEVGLFNTPDFLLPAEAASIAHARKARLASYNDHRAAFQYPRVTAFEQINGSRRVQDALRAVYGNVDEVEYFVGLFAEEPRPNAAVPSLIGRMVSIDAFSQALTNPLLSEHVYNRDTFTAAGMDVIASTRRLQDLLDRNTPQKPGTFLATMAQTRAEATGPR